MNIKLKRILSLFLVLVMCMSLVPASALADDGEEPEETETAQVQLPEEEAVTEEPAGELPAEEEAVCEEPEHVHDYALVEEIPAAEEAEGVKEHYVCTSCGGLFILTEGEYVEVTEQELVIPALNTEPAQNEEEPEQTPEEEKEETEEELDLETSLAGEIVDEGTCGAEGDNLTWVLTDDGTLTISGSGAMAYYSTADYSGVTATSAPWGQYYSVITQANVGAGVTTIGEFAFYGCSSLTSIDIPSGVTVMGCAFYGCSGLTSIDIPDSVTEIGNSTFWGCSGLTSVAIPDSVTRIGDSAFRGCSGLTSIDIPDSVTEIGDSAFRECSGLTGIEIPSGVTCISDATFSCCSGLTSIEIPAWVEDIDEFAFVFCSALQSIEVDSANTIYRSENNCIIKKSTNELVLGCKTSVIPSGVTAIGTCAFRGCSALTSIVIPASVTSIEYYYFGSAFYGCSALQSIEVDSANTIYRSENNCIIKKSTNELVLGCKTSVIPSGVTAIGLYAFSCCSGLTSIAIPNGVTAIRPDAFSDCSGLTSIAIPSGVTSIGENAFRGCNALEDVYYAGSEEDWNDITIEANNEPLVGGNIHYNGIVDSGTCGAEGDNLTWVLTDDGTLTISGTGAMENYYFETSVPWYQYHDRITQAVLESGVTSIGAYAFYGCSGMTSIELPDSLTSIGAYAFYDCSGLTGVAIPDSVTTIGYWAFYFCNALTGIVIPSGVTTIEGGVFYDCSSLTSIAIPSGVTSIGEDAFLGCSALEDVYYAGSEEDWNNITIEANNEQLTGAAIHYNGIVDSGTCGAGRDNVLWTMYMDGRLVISGHGEMDDYAQANYSENPATSAPWGRHFADILTVEVESGVTGIGNNAFYGCCNLSNVTVADSVTSIGDYAFSACRNMADITFSDNITRIGSGAFFYCFALTDVTLPDSLTTIGNAAFFGCSGLTGIIIPESVVNVGDGAFAHCTSMTDVTIPKSVINIGDSAFLGCSALTDVYYAGTADDWDGISIGTDNAPLTSANFHFENVYVKASGECGASGDNVLWTLYSDSRLEITGTGAMEDYHVAYSSGRNSTSAPWGLYCKRIKTVGIGTGVTNIGTYAFSYCNNLSSVTIGADVALIGDSAFSNSGLTGITVDAGNSAFKSEGNCVIDKTSNVLVLGCRATVIPDSVTGIGAGAFKGCSGMSNTLTIPDNVTSIGSGAFASCFGLTSITIPDSVTDIGAGAFSASSLIRVSLSKNITVIEASTFENCGILTDITLPEGLTSIGMNAFRYCDSLDSINIPSSVTEIGSGAFIKVDYAEARNPKIRKVYIQDLEAWCAIDFADAGANPLMPGGAVYNTQMNRGQLYVNNKLVTNLVLPEGLTAVKAATFAGIDVKSITIPDSVTSIGESAFRVCSAVSVNIPDNVASIGSGAFWGCDKLTRISIPNGVSSIGELAFCNCRGLTSIVIPDSVTEIGYSAFAICTRLKTATIGSGVTAIGENAFSETVLKDLYYNGTIEGWEAIAIADPNDELAAAKIHFRDLLARFFLDGDKTLPENLYQKTNVVKGAVLAEPADPPAAPGYTFGGWYTAPDYKGEKYNFSSKVTDNVTLFAHWDNASMTASDVFSFNSDMDPFECNTKDYYEISDEDYAWLMGTPGLSDSVRDIINNSIGSGYDGSMFGMSAVTVLAKAGLLNPADFGAAAVSGLKIDRSEAGMKVLSLINYYEMLKNVGGVSAVLNDYSRDESANLKRIYADLSGGQPVILNVGRGSNRVLYPVAFGLEDTDYGFTFRIYDSKVTPRLQTVSVKIEENGEYRVVDYAEWQKALGYNGKPIYTKQTMFFRCAVTAADLAGERLLTAPGGGVDGSSESWSADDAFTIGTTDSSFVLSVVNGNGGLIGKATVESGMISKIVTEENKKALVPLDIREAAPGEGEAAALKLPAIEKGQKLRLENVCGTVTVEYRPQTGKSFTIVLSSEAEGTLELNRDGRVSFTEACTLSYSSDSLTTSWRRVEVSGEACGLTLIPEGNDAVRAVPAETADLTVTLFRGSNSRVITENVSGTNGLLIDENSLSGEEIGCSVTFNSMYGSEVEPILNLPAGSTVAKPADPEREHFIFTAWYKDRACTEEWQFEGSDSPDTVEEDITLYAGWEAAQVRTVSFWLDGVCITARGYEEDQPVTDAPKDENGMDYEWFTSEDLSEGTEWNLETDTVSGILRLYGRVRTYTVTFLAHEDEHYEYTGIAYGSTVDDPEINGEGRTVIGWYRDEDLTDIWSFAEDTVTEDITLYADWADNMTETGICVRFTESRDGVFSYTGGSICPEISVRFNGTLLENGIDYSVSYKNNKKVCDKDNAGIKDSAKPQAVITLKGNYKAKDKLTVYFSIEAFNLADAIVTYPEVVAVKAKDAKQTVTVTVYNGSAVIPKAEYAVKYYDGNRQEVPGITSAGEYYVGVVPSAKTVSLTGELMCENPIRVAAVTDISKLKSRFSLSFKDSMFNGSEQKPEVIAAASLAENEDYIVTYPVNVTDAGTCRITVTGTGDYYGSFTLDYKIKPLDLKAAYSEGDLIVSCEKSVTYSPGGAAPKVTVEYKGVELKEGSDYTLKYAGNKKVGTAGTVKLTGKGSFKGTLDSKTAPELTFTIGRKLLSSTDVSVSIKTMTRKSGKWSVKLYAFDGMVELKGGEFTLEIAESPNSEKLVLRISAKPNGNYAGMRRIELPKDQVDISDKKLAAVALPDEGPFEYTGKAITPEVEVKTLEGTDLKDRVKITYSRNVETGTATVTVTGIPEKGAYGTETKTFKIVPPQIF